jgi:hypothetical protein
MNAIEIYDGTLQLALEIRELDRIYRKYFGEFVRLRSSEPLVDTASRNETTAAQKEDA